MGELSTMYSHLYEINEKVQEFGVLSDSASPSKYFLENLSDFHNTGAAYVEKATKLLSSENTGYSDNYLTPWLGWLSKCLDHLNKIRVYSDTLSSLMRMNSWDENLVHNADTYCGYVTDIFLNISDMSSVPQYIGNYLINITRDIADWKGLYKTYLSAKDAAQSVEYAKLARDFCVRHLKNIDDDYNRYFRILDLNDDLKGILSDIIKRFDQALGMLDDIANSGVFFDKQVYRNVMQHIDRAIVRHEEIIRYPGKKYGEWL